MYKLANIFFSISFLQNEIATSSGLLSRSLQIAHDIPVPELSGNNYWHLDDQSPTLPNSQFLGMPPPPYDVSTSQLYTSLSSQPSLHNNMYNSSDWVERYGTYTVAGEMPVPSTVVTSFQSPPAYPYNFPETNYSHGSLRDESPISSPESIDSFTDSHYNFGSQSSLLRSNSPLAEHMNGIANTAPPTMMMNYETQSSYPTMRYSDNHRIQLDTKPLKKAIRMPQSKYSSHCSAIYVS